MKAFIITSMALAAIGVVARLVLLCGKYPRKREEVESWQDVLGVLAGAAWCMWAWSVIH